MSMGKPLEKEFDYYLKNQARLVRKYRGKHIVIKDHRVIGTYRSTLEAIEKTSAKYALGTFLIQKCTPGEKDYTRYYHSRVAFV